MVLVAVALVASCMSPEMKKYMRTTVATIATWVTCMHAHVVRCENRLTIMKTADICFIILRIFFLHMLH
jgi:hypothetical protein